MGQGKRRHGVWLDLTGIVISQEIGLCPNQSQSNGKTLRSNVWSDINDTANRKVLCLEEIRARAWRLRGPVCHQGSILNGLNLALAPAQGGHTLLRKQIHAFLW